MQKKRIWGWFFFDWAAQPYYTILLTFIFGPYFVSIAQDAFQAQGLDPDVAKSDAQGMWSLGLTVTGLIIGFSAPFLGAMADASRRRLLWIFTFSAMCAAGASGLWFVLPDGSNLWWALLSFGLGFIGAEFALIFTNGQLPSLGTKKEVGQISGSGFAFGYLGGLIALIVVLVFFVEQDSGKTIGGLDPLFDLDPSQTCATIGCRRFSTLKLISQLMMMWINMMKNATSNSSVAICRSEVIDLSQFLST